MFDRTIRYKDAALPVQQHELPGYFLDFQRGGDVLFVTFENAELVRDRGDGLRVPWGFNFLRKHGFSVLGVKPKRRDWYRGADLHAFFRSADFAAFRAGFARTIFYGSSMGGYAALVFSDIADDCEALAFNPQSTLDARLVPWDNRYPEGTAQDWSGDFADAGRVRRARRALVCYDPMFALDRRHVERLDLTNVQLLKIPFVGHAVSQWLAAMRVLHQVVLGYADGSLTPLEGARLARGRRKLPRYYAQLARATRRPAVAAACLRRLDSLGGPNDGLLRDLLPVARRHGLWEATADLARRHLESEPASEAAHRILVEALLQEGPGQAAAAAAALATALDLLPRSAGLHQLDAQRLLAEGNPAAAAGAAQRAIALQPRQVTGHLLLTEALLALGEAVGAAEAARHLIALEPQRKRGLRLLAAAEALPLALPAAG